MMKCVQLLSDMWMCRICRPESQEMSEDITDEPRPKKRARRSGRAARTLDAPSARSARVGPAPNWLPQAPSQAQAQESAAMAVAARVTRDRSTTSSAAELVPRRGRRRLLDTASARGAQHTLPFTEEQLVDSPFEQFAQMLAMPGLSESQLQLMKDIRRRGSRAQSWTEYYFKFLILKYIFHL